MNNISNQVSPKNRVDFSKIRKAQQGIKTQNVSGITYADGTTWHGSMFSQIVGDIKNMLSNPSLTPEDKNALVQELNELQGAYAKIRATHPILNPSQFDQKVKEYQQQIINKYNFVNTKGVAYGNNSEHQRYVYGQSDPTRRVTGDNAGKNNDWANSADGYMSGITRDRTLLGYEGDWDENSNDFQTWQDWLKGVGLETYMDTDKAYKLRELNTPSELESPANVSPTEPTSPVEPSVPDNTSVEEYEDVKFETLPGRKTNPWTDWIPLSGMLGNNLINNSRVFNDEVQKKFPLQEALYNQGKVTNNYVARQIRNQQIANARTRAQQQMGSDLVQNQNYLNAVEQRADELENQNAIDQTQEFNATSQRLQEIGNQNKVQGAATANYNRQQNAAAWNNILAARQKLNTANAAELNSYMGNMYASHAQWLQNERLEDARYQREINDYSYQKRLNNLYETSGLKALEEGIQNSSAFNNFRKILEEDIENTNIALDENGHITDDAILNYISEHSEDDDVKALSAAYEKEKADAMSRYEHDQQGLIAQRTRANMNIPSTFSNQGLRLGDRYLRRSIPQTTWISGYKSGGKVNARFIDYMNHYQKQQQFDRKENRRVQENLQKKLARDLDYLDKETLLLLKQIFK